MDSCRILSVQFSHRQHDGNDDEHFVDRHLCFCFVGLSSRSFSQVLGAGEICANWELFEMSTGREKAMNQMEGSTGIFDLLGEKGYGS